MNRPALELLLGPASSSALVDLLRQIGRRWARLEARVDRRPAARLVSAWSPERVRSAVRDPSVPAAIWFDRPEELESIGDDLARVAALVGERDVAADVPGSIVVPSPARSIDASSWRAASSFVRQRRRAQHALPDDLVIVVGTEAEVPLDPAARATSLSLVSAAAVVGPWALPALALATPIVTDHRTASWLELTDGVDALVAEPAHLEGAARRLAADPRHAARLGWAGRMHVEANFDTACSADHLALALGLPYRTPGLGGVRSALTTLRTPAGSIPSARVAEALSGLGTTTAEAVRAWTW